MLAIYKIMLCAQHNINLFCIYNIKLYIYIVKSINSKYPLLEKTSPEECTGSRINRVCRVINKIYRNHLKEIGITLSQLNILFAVGKNPNIYQADVAQFLKLEPSTLSRDLERLITKGYMIKGGYANKPNLNLTEKGYLYLEKIIPVWEQAKNEADDFIDREGVLSLNYLTKKL